MKKRGTDENQLLRLRTAIKKYGVPYKIHGFNDICHNFVSTSTKKSLDET